MHYLWVAGCELCRLWLASYCEAGPRGAVHAAGVAACELSKLVSSAGCGSHVDMLALLCMMRLLLACDSAGSGCCACKLH